MVDLSKMSTEQVNPNTAELSSMSIREAIEVINRENYNAVACIEPQYEMLERVIELTSQALEQGGRIIYMGAGTSGRTPYQEFFKSKGIDLTTPMIVTNGADMEIEIFTGKGVEKGNTVAICCRN
ncbi:MAG: hypothetical protein Q4P20_10720 [Eubacteriales bacterium]|nr:hypothetical protein [Eubacteriales bacterium]